MEDLLIFEVKERSVVYWFFPQMAATLSIGLGQAESQQFYPGFLRGWQKPKHMS